MKSSKEISRSIKEYAYEIGFNLVGITPAGINWENHYFLDWLNEGFEGEMHYLKRNSEKRSDLNKVLPGARSVISCAINYNTDFPYSDSLENKNRGWIARYAWGDDYHDVLMEKLNMLKDYFYSFYKNQPHVKAYVDTGPVLEKAYSQYAGIGWIGKNTCLINQKIGSWLLLGELITDAELEFDNKAADRCGTCTRCIDACPTDAIVEPYILDSRKCISYLTIELKNKIPFEIREGIDNNIFGCDICQDVCPWNKKAPVTHLENFQPRENLFNPDLKTLAGLTHEEFSEVFKKNPVKRTKRRGLLRNIIVAMGNTGSKEFLNYIEKMLTDSEPLLRLHAVWALWKIEGKESLSKIKTLLENEEDNEVLEEIKYILKIEAEDV